MLDKLMSSLTLLDLFEACIWAVACCAFWGLMGVWEVTVRSRNAFSPAFHLARANTLLGTDLNSQNYARLDLPSAKTAMAGEIQHVILVEQDSLCPLDALRHLASVVPIGPSDPLFSWRDTRGNIRHMVRDTALQFLNNRLTKLEFGTTVGHSFRIGGASFFLRRSRKRHA